MQSPTVVSPLDAFLQQPDIEGSPAWEFIDGQPQQKLMPTLYHSCLQRNLVNFINERTCMSNGTRLSWLIDIQLEQVWVWQAQELPLIYSGSDLLPAIEDLTDMTVASVISMTQRKSV